MSSLLKYFREDFVRRVWAVTTAIFAGTGSIARTKYAVFYRTLDKFSTLCFFIH
jgi:hypothetical protein